MKDLGLKITKYIETIKLNLGEGQLSQELISKFENQFNTEEAIKNYKEKVLIPLLGKGDFSRNLSKKIENIFYYPQRNNQEITLDTPIKDLNISVRLYNRLRLSDIEYLGEVVKMKEEEVIKVRSLGKKSLKELKELLRENNLPELGAIDYIKSKDRSNT